MVRAPFAHKIYIIYEMTKHYESYSIGAHESKLDFINANDCVN